MVVLPMSAKYPFHMAPMSMKQRSWFLMILSVASRCGGDMCSPDATNGVMTWAISPPSWNRVCIASAATSNSRRPALVSSRARWVTESPIAQASSITATSRSVLIHRALCITVSPSTNSRSGKWAAIDRMNEMLAWSTASLPEVSPLDSSSGVRMSLTKPSTSSRCSMIGTAWDSPIQLIPNRALSISPPEPSRIGSESGVRSEPLSDVVLPAMSWARRAVR